MRRRSNPSAKKSSLSQYGLLDIPNFDVEGDEDMDVSDDDLDLEAELAAIAGGGAKRPARKPAPVAAGNLDAMIAESLKDLPDDDDDVASGDEEDPDLLNELQELTLDEAPPALPSRVSRTAPPPPGESNSMVSLLQERISNYTLAEQNAKANNESSRARRFNRGLKTLNDLLKQAKAGRPVNEEDIPPPVSTGKQDTPSGVPQPQEQPPPPPPRSLSLKKDEPSVPEPSEPAPRLPEPATPPPVLPSTDNFSPEKQQGLMFILKRKEEFKAAALASKQAGDKTLALELLKVAKQFDLVIDAYKSGQEMDLTELPTTELIVASVKSAQKEDTRQETAAAPEPALATDASGLITASSVEEALKQRLAVFQEQETKAREDGNSSKLRRMGRIVKQYQDAIKAHSVGKPIAYDELPTPPGYAPIPGDTPSTSQPSPAQLKPQPSPAASRPAPTNQATRAEKQLAFLLMRQKEFKDAAIRAKKEGDLVQAKEYLRLAKGFDSVLDAARGGLAVDLKSLPVPPGAKDKLDKLEQTFDVVNPEECGPPTVAPPVAIDGDVLTHLYQQLTSQLKLCILNRDHCRAMGNIPEMNRFENLAVTVQQDLDIVTVCKRSGQDPPKFHYEARQFSIVQCNTDLNENDLELTIVRGIAYNVPNPREVDTYVKFEFPYPQETPVSDRTSLVKDTNSPEYNAVFPLAINRSARPCLRVFKRHGIKFEVYSRGCGLCACLCACDVRFCCSGWFSKDTLLGTVTVKLAQLETQVTMHESYQLMDGRRPAGGSLEVKMRVRTPILQQQIEKTTHRWLCIDS